MKKKKILKKIGIVLLVALVVIQFFRIDKTNPEVKEGNDIISLLEPSEEVQELLKANCYDCHSNQVVYPWYSNIAPVSWVVAHHIEEGRGHLNFSAWGDYSAKKQHHKLEECYEEMEENEMPLSNYELMHGAMSDEDREKLEEWFRSL